MQSKGLRLSEKWFQRGLWIIAVLFASFLIGLGALVVGDLPKVERPVNAEQWIDQAQIRPLRAAAQADQQQIQDVADTEARARLDAEHARAAYTSERESFDAWVATRSATEQSSQNAEVTARTRKLDELKVLERAAATKVEALETQSAALEKKRRDDDEKIATVEGAAQGQLDKAVQRQELRVFGLRLLLTLPLLALAVWLFIKKRKSPRWPFVWGFIFFALFTFFFELVPYLPSYGGYFRYMVGIALTVWGGNYAIGALRKYLEAQKASEQQPEEQRRSQLGYEAAQMRLAKRICPACERPIDIADPAANFCMHCGLLVFEACGRCGTRQTSFSHFCRACGLVKRDAPPEEPTPPAPLAAPTA